MKNYFMFKIAPWLQINKIEKDKEDNRKDMYVLRIPESVSSNGIEFILCDGSTLIRIW